MSSTVINFDFLSHIVPALSLSSWALGIVNSGHMDRFCPALGVVFICMLKITRNSRWHS